MEAKFWHNRWKAKEIGFHQKKTNALLAAYWQKILASEDDKVFVPLCGKSKDMLWLAERGHSVVGVELSPLAAEAFFAENNLLVKKQPRAGFNLYQTKNIQLLVGDFFNLTKADLKDCQWVYDRAALIAFPPEMRTRYASHLQQILPSDAAIFLVTLDYDPKEMKGPPFPVTESEVKRLFESSFSIDHLDSREVLEMNPRFVDKGLSGLNEAVYLLSPKA